MSAEGLTTKPQGAPVETTTATFRADVLEESLKRPVLVDFWAPWCGPCKQLAPIIERVVKATQGKVALVKMNVEDHPEIAGQLGISSIPAVIAFQRGRPVDGFVGALPESQIKGFIERLVGPVENDIDSLAVAEELLLEGRLDEAEALLREMAGAEQPNPKAIAELCRLLIATGRLEEAGALLAGVPADLARDPAVAGAAAALENAAAAAELGEIESLRERVAADPGDMQAAFDLALALNAKGLREEAGDALLDIIRKDRSWNEDGARKQLLQFFEAWGPMDKATIGARRRLSALLFS